MRRLFHLFLLDTIFAFTTEYCACRTGYVILYKVYTWHVFLRTECCAAAAAAAAPLDVAILLLSLQLLLLAAAARHRMPLDKICCWFIESDSCVLFLFIQTRFIFYAPLGITVAFSASICL